METLVRSRLISPAKDMLSRLVILTPFNLRRFLFARLAESLDVSLVQVNGPIGKMLGSIHDEGIFYPYLGRFVASDLINTYIQHFFSTRGSFGTFVDIGANIGLVTIPIAQNPAVRCKAFEPEPLNYQLLAWNVASNCPYGNVETVNIALWRERATLEFELSPNNLGDHRVQPQCERNQPSHFNESARKRINVTGASLDQMVDSTWVKSPLVIKMDTQGAEIEIIHGGEATISKADLLILEFWPYAIRRFESDVAGFFDYVGKTFQSGAIIPAWKSITRLEKSSFRSIQEIVSELREFFRESLPEEQVDIFLRRDQEPLAPRKA